MTSQRMHDEAEISIVAATVHAEQLQLRRFAAAVAPSHVDPDDLFHDALVSVLRAEQRTPILNPSGYMRRAITNLASNRRRSWRREQAASRTDRGRTRTHVGRYPTTTTTSRQQAPDERWSMAMNDHDRITNAFQQLTDPVDPDKGAELISSAHKEATMSHHINPSANPQRRHQRTAQVITGLAAAAIVAIVAAVVVLRPGRNTLEVQPADSSGTVETVASTPGPSITEQSTTEPSTAEVVPGTSATTPPTAAPPSTSPTVTSTDPPRTTTTKQPPATTAPTTAATCTNDPYIWLADAAAEYGVPTRGYQESARLLQQRLADLGYYDGPVDGYLTYDSGAVDGAIRWATDNGYQDEGTQWAFIPDAGFITPDVMSALGLTCPNEPSNCVLEAGWSSDSEPAAPPEYSLTSERVQTRLAELGFDPGEIDGYFGPNSIDALTRWAAESPKRLYYGTEGWTGYSITELGFDDLGISC